MSPCCGFDPGFLIFAQGEYPTDPPAGHSFVTLAAAVAALAFLAALVWVSP